ncbi:MAG: sulfite exporter TauE/SafE family protein [Candidatus Methanomethylophilaceae archaeon]|nr:sulfite exporter TauE/SafE family protein [Candidatus Methanomethylophilaceae archaeon]
MDPIILLGLIAVGIGAGILGGIFGVGGGVIFVPILLLVFHLSPAEAAATSLIGIISGSAGASSVQIRSGRSNIRLGLFLEISTAIGAIIGAAIAVYLDDHVLILIFVVVIAAMGIKMLLDRKAGDRSSEPEDGRFTFPYEDDSGETRRFKVEHVKGSVPLCLGAGMVSSITGIGGGAIKVPIMNMYMGVPIKVATATSSYMIGITAFTGAIAYLVSGIVVFEYAAWIAIGAFFGSILGVAISRRLDGRRLKRYFGIFMLTMAVLILLQEVGVLD